MAHPEGRGAIELHAQHRASPAFKEPRLDIIETKGGDKPAATGKVEEQRRVNNFTIVVQQKGQETSEADAGAGSAAGKGGKT